MAGGAHLGCTIRRDLRDDTHSCSHPTRELCLRQAVPSQSLAFCPLEGDVSFLEELLPMYFSALSEEG